MSINYDPSRGADDEFIDGQNAEMYEALLKELKRQSSNRWQYDEIDYCWTGKDADLETHGYQGLHLDSIDDEWISATVHTGKTVGGDDVCLNDPEGASEEDQYAAAAIYLEQAQEMVCGCGQAGEWSGDDWFLAETFSIKVKTPLSATTGKLGAKRAVTLLYKAAQKALADWDHQMEILDGMLDVLAGWKDSKGERVLEGTITEGSAWDQLNWCKENNVKPPKRGGFFGLTFSEEGDEEILEKENE